MIKCLYSVIVVHCAVARVMHLAHSGAAVGQLSGPGEYGGVGGCAAPGRCLRRSPRAAWPPAAGHLWVGLLLLRKYDPTCSYTARPPDTGILPCRRAEKYNLHCLSVTLFFPPF